ncbi:MULTISPECIES: DUF4810 domain-containing protein [Pseudomonas]|uniref:DUF4810 domain-containing protein n=1 Tax=Pseudomonas TaxID=286 RepID=UPI0003FEAEB2|nr:MULTISPECIES: DUF4810 domain-containing protein [unclassified Pseudomonas]MCU9949614.1 DUF4810 domain-containing protein [Pseudomonas sp. PDM13]WCD83030.1 DUF4810 domain-containing protein [Pseudomonas sp. TUM22785]
MSRTIACAAALLGSLALAGCSGPKTLYQWEGYQTQVNQYFKGESKEAQVEALEADLQKIRAKNGAVPPGYHAQLGLLYSSLGKDDEMMRSFETEKALFPESASYMDFLMKNAKGGAQ